MAASAQHPGPLHAQFVGVGRGGDCAANRHLRAGGLCLCPAALPGAQPALHARAGDDHDPQRDHAHPKVLYQRRVPLLGGNDWLGAGGSGLYDSYAAILLPGLVGAFNIFLLRQAFLTVPVEFWEAAQLDGCRSFDYLWRVLLPISLPALLTVGIFGFIGRWNGLLWPLLVTRSESIRPVQMAMIYYQNEFVTDYGMLMAASLMVTLPIVVLFVLVQRQFIEGIISTGLKG